MRKLINRIAGSRAGRRVSGEYDNRALWGPAHPAKPTAIAGVACGAAVLLEMPGWVLALPLVVAHVQRGRRRRYRRRVADELRRLVCGPR